MRIASSIKTAYHKPDIMQLTFSLQPSKGDYKKRLGFPGLFLFIIMSNNLQQVVFDKRSGRRRAQGGNGEEFNALFRNLTDSFAVSGCASR